MAIMPMVNCGTRKASMDDSAHGGDHSGMDMSPGMAMPASPAPASPSHADAKVYTYDWTTAEGDSGFPMPQVECGDTVRLTWPKNETHGVYKVTGAM